VEKIVEDNKHIFSFPIGVPMHYQVNHSIDLKLGAPLPNGAMYKSFFMENEEIER
jgi:hypothetical protein